MSSQTRSISFTKRTFDLMEQKRKEENRDRSNFINHRLHEYFANPANLPAAAKDAVAKANKRAA